MFVIVGSPNFLTLGVVKHLGRIRKTLRVEDMAMSIDLRSIEDVHRST